MKFVQIFLEKKIFTDFSVEPHVSLQSSFQDTFYTLAFAIFKGIRLYLHLNKMCVGSR